MRQVTRLSRIRELSLTVSRVSEAYDTLRDHTPSHVATDAMLTALLELSSKLKDEVRLLGEETWCEDDP